VAELLAKPASRYTDEIFVLSLVYQAIIRTKRIL
jgi:hypothetical protein